MNIKKAILVTTYFNEKDNYKEKADELKKLCETLDITDINSKHIKLKEITAATYITKGKIEELINIIEEGSIVIFNNEISPVQQRNLEKKLKVRVIDRTYIIIKIFELHAKTKEAKLEVMLANEKYNLPRLKNLWSHLSRQRGGGLYLKGEGEKQIELDKQMIKHKISHIKSELKKIKQQRSVQKKSRLKSGLTKVAIVGYTNSGKSTLLNTITKSNILSEDKLFATLDTTTKKYTLPNKQKILISDTVGFIDNIPHLLIESFNSTISECIDADILLNVIDISDQYALEKSKQAYKILKNLNIDNKKIINVLNKIDLYEDEGRIYECMLHFSNNIKISAIDDESVKALIHKLEEKTSEQLFLKEILITPKDYSLINLIHEKCYIKNKEYIDDNILITAYVDKKYDKYFKRYYKKG